MKICEKVPLSPKNPDRFPETLSGLPAGFLFRAYRCTNNRLRFFRLLSALLSPPRFTGTSRVLGWFIWLLSVIPPFSKDIRLFRLAAKYSLYLTPVYEV